MVKIISGERIMKKILMILIMIVMILNFFCGASFASSKKNFRENSCIVDNIDEALWQKTVEIYLKDDLWTEQNAYDACHYLMVPMHAAFLLRKYEWEEQFNTHFLRFLEAYQNGNAIVEGRLNRLHYFYLMSRFLALSLNSNNYGILQKELQKILYDEIEILWTKDPAWMWGKKPFIGGMRERFAWKFSGAKLPYSYCKAVIDEELFVFSIAADLRSIERVVKTRATWSPLISDILDAAYDVFKKESSFLSDDGWLFQIGVWADHGDYAYVGHLQKGTNLEPKPLRDVSSDVSHSHRFPLWILSLRDAYESSDEEYQYYEKVRKGLAKQFTEKVLIPPSNVFQAYRTTNFMDGRNGIYRWNYKTQGPNNGYGPYELSGTFMLGWWAFCGSKIIDDSYGEMVKAFPLSERIISVYTGPNTTRERHSLVKFPDFFKNGYSELLVRLASKMPVF